MKEFRTLLNVFKGIHETIGSLRDAYHKGELTSTRLIQLITHSSESEIGLLPEGIKETIEEFDQLIKWKRIAGPSKAEIPEPQQGIDENFDRANE